MFNVADAILAFFFVCNVFADLGPKPTVEIKLDIHVPIDIDSGQLIQCEDLVCLKSHPLEAAGPQDFSCSEKQCTGMAYGFAKLSKLKLKINGKFYESNSFRLPDMQNKLKANFDGTKLKVEK